jgi:hypothetical protein
MRQPDARDRRLGRDGRRRRSDRQYARPQPGKSPHRRSSAERLFVADSRAIMMEHGFDRQEEATPGIDATAAAS